jgi:FKBP-type peptidyl-prolyl cis-trans isomerase
MFKASMAAALLLGIAGPAAAQPALETDQDKTLYALGVAIGTNVQDFDLSAADLAIVSAGIGDAALGNELKVDMQVYGPMIQQLADERVAARAAAEKEAAAAFLYDLAQETGAERSASGVVYVPVTVGTGANPTAADTVRVHYHGTLRDGTVFDSSVDRGEPVTFPLSGPTTLADRCRTGTLSGSRQRPPTGSAAMNPDGPTGLCAIIRCRRPTARRGSSRSAATATCGSRSMPATASAASPRTATITEFPIPTPDSQPRAIALGADGNIWFGHVRGRQDRPDHAGAARSPSSTSRRPTAARARWRPGPDGNIWFSEFHAGKIGRITPTGQITEFDAAAPRIPAPATSRPAPTATCGSCSSPADGRPRGRRQPRRAHHDGRRGHRVPDPQPDRLADQHRGRPGSQHLVHQGRTARSRDDDGEITEFEVTARNRGAPASAPAATVSRRSA